MRANADLPVTVTADLRITTERSDPMTPGQALRLAEALTVAAMVRRASLMQMSPPGTRRRRAGAMGHLSRGLLAATGL